MRDWRANDRQAGMGAGAVSPRGPFDRRRLLRRAAAGTVSVVLIGGVSFGVMERRVETLERQVAEAERAEYTAQAQVRLLDLHNRNLRDTHAYSSEYGIPADLAASIYEIALSEGLDPEIAFRLVQVESSFRRGAVSEAGAVGYTQLMPSTAQWLDPGVTEADLFERDTNLRLGFRYLRLMLLESGGDVELALLAYNRGPGRVRAIVSRGENPANGYARQVLSDD